MVLPSNGAGITIAMIGGRIAGNVIHEHLEHGVPLKEYEKRWKKQMGQVMKNSKRSFKLGSLLLRFPDWLINLTFNRLTKKYYLASDNLQKNVIHLLAKQFDL